MGGCSPSSRHMKVNGRHGAIPGIHQESQIPPRLTQQDAQVALHFAMRLASASNSRVVAKSLRYVSSACAPSLTGAPLKLTTYRLIGSKHGHLVFDKVVQPAAWYSR